MVSAKDPEENSRLSMSFTNISRIQNDDQNKKRIVVIRLSLNLRL